MNEINFFSKEINHFRLFHHAKPICLQFCALSMHQNNFYCLPKCLYLTMRNRYLVSIGSVTYVVVPCKTLALGAFIKNDIFCNDRCDDNQLGVRKKNYLSTKNQVGVKQKQADESETYCDKLSSDNWLVSDSKLSPDGLNVRKTTQDNNIVRTRKRN